MRFQVILAFAVMTLSGLGAADPATPAAAVAGLGVTGTTAVAPRQIREALCAQPAIRRLVRSGKGIEILATTAVPMVIQGYQSVGFADVQVIVDGGALVIQEGPRRVWGDLRVEASTPEATALATALLGQRVLKASGLPDQPKVAGETDPALVVRGESARFDRLFPGLVQSRLEQGWAAKGRSRPMVEVVVEPFADTTARCVVRIAEPPVTPIQEIRVEGALANGGPAILAWLDREAGLRPGSPGDVLLLDAACGRLADTGRLVKATARLEAGGIAIVTVVEHPLLPRLADPLTPWQERWLDLGRQMLRHFETGPGLRIRLEGLPLDLAATVGRTGGTSLTLEAPRGGPACTLSWSEGVLTLARRGLPPVAWRSSTGGIYGDLGFAPTEDPERSFDLRMSLGFSTTSTRGVQVICAPAALLAASGGSWSEVPGRAGTWRKQDRQGKPQFETVWDAQGAWKQWDLITGSMTIHLAPAEVPVNAGSRPGPGLTLWQEALREPDRWLKQYADQPWADLALGVSAVVARPAAALWTVDGAASPDRVPFSIPADPAWAVPGLNPDHQGMALMVGYLSDVLGSTCGSEVWPVWLVDGVSSLVEGDQAGCAAILQYLDRPGVLGPLGRLAEASLLRIGGLPGAEEAARSGLAICTAEAAYADLVAAVGSEDQLLRWVLAIDHPGDALRLVPSVQRPVLKAALATLQAAPPAERKTLLAAAFRRWWEADLGWQVRQRLESISGSAGKF